MAQIFVAFSEKLNSTHSIMEGFVTVFNFVFRLKPSWLVTSRASSYSL